jgi:hypothetical protein
MMFLLSLVAAFMLMVGAARAQDSAEAHKVKAGNYVLEETSHSQFCSKRLRVNVKGNFVALGTEWSFTWKAHDRQVDPRRSDSKCTIAYRQEIIPGEAKLVRDSTEVCTEGDASPSVRESLSVRGDVLELSTQALTKPAAEWIVDSAKEPLRCVWRRK